MRSHPYRAQAMVPVFRGFAASSSDTVALSCIAVYIHQQINGTFDNLFDQLYDLVDELGIPNDGSITQVPKDDAPLLIEVIGACSGDFDDFLAEDAVLEKSLNFIEESVAVNTDAAPRHPRFVRLCAESDLGCDADPSEDETTEALRMRCEREAIGIFIKETKNGKLMFFSRDKATHPVGLKHMKKYPVDAELNVWFKSHMRVGWKPCGGGWCGIGCAWFNIDAEDPPIISPELVRDGCAGFCKRARNTASKSDH